MSKETIAGFSMVVGMLFLVLVMSAITQCPSAKERKAATNIPAQSVQNVPAKPHATAKPSQRSSKVTIQHPVQQPKPKVSKSKKVQTISYCTDDGVCYDGITLSEFIRNEKIEAEQEERKAVSYSKQANEYQQCYSRKSKRASKVQEKANKAKREKKKERKKAKAEKWSTEAQSCKQQADYYYGLVRQAKEKAAQHRNNVYGAQKTLLIPN